MQVTLLHYCGVTLLQHSYLGSLPHLIYKNEECIAKFFPNHHYTGYGIVGMEAAMAVIRVPLLLFDRKTCTCISSYKDPFTSNGQHTDCVHV